MILELIVEKQYIFPDSYFIHNQPFSSNIERDL